MILPPDQYIEPSASPRDGSAPDEEEVNNDAIQLLLIATFNGLCRTITALALRQQLSAQEIDGIHDAMATPLDDEQWRDDEFVAACRRTLEQVLAEAVCLSRGEPIRED